MKSKSTLYSQKYIFENKELILISFENENLPKISIEEINNCIFVYVKKDNRVLLSGLATKSYINELAINNNSKFIEVTEFQNLISFSSVEELISKLE